MPADWYIVKPDRELGPYTGAQMKQLAAAGQLDPSHLVRRADREEPIRASQVRGLFEQTNKAAEPLRSTPPPLPTEVRSAKPTGVSEPPPLPGAGSSRSSLHERIEVVKEATRGAARLASVEARRAHIKMVTLPAAYLALGRDVAQGGRFRTEFQEIYGEIDRIRAELARLTTGEKEKPGASLSDKARQAAKAVTDTVQAKALGLKLRAAQQKLGEAVHPVHGAESADPTLVQPIDEALTELATIEAKLDQEEESQRGRLVTPRRVLYATAGTIVLGVFVIARSGPKVTEGRTTPPPAATPSSLVASEAGHGVEQIPGMEPIPVPDFSKVDYSHRCPKDDEPLPVGSKLETRFIQITKEDAKRVGEPVEGDASYVGQWAEEQGYRAQDGSFVIHGIRTLWYDADRQKKLSECQWLHGKQHGPRTIRYESGDVFTKVHLAHGDLHGHGQKWFDNGKLWADEWFFEGRLHGVSRRYYANGQIESEQTYVNGQRQGLLKEWHKNGQKALEVAYVNGVREGPLRAWFEDGRPREESRLVNGKHEGLAKLWWGDLSEPDELNYLHGELHGRALRHTQDGKLFNIAIYQHGDVISPGIDSRAVTVAEFMAKMKAGSAKFGESRSSLLVIWQKDAWNEVFGAPQSGSQRYRWLYVCRDGVLELVPRPGEEGQIIVTVDNLGGSN